VNSAGHDAGPRRRPDTHVAARAAFESALAASPDHLGARQELDAIGRPKR
jgi:hypothetical protein